MASNLAFVKKSSTIVENQGPMILYFSSILNMKLFFWNGLTNCLIRLSLQTRCGQPQMYD